MDHVELVELPEPALSEKAVPERGLFGSCLAVAASGPEVCDVCCGGRLGPFELCHSCRGVGRALKRPLLPVTPISLTKRTTALYSALKQYKGRTNQLSRRQQVRLAGLIGTFVELHGSCIAPHGFDVVAVVPSRQVPTEENPLAVTIAMVPALAFASPTGPVGRPRPCRSQLGVRIRVYLRRRAGRRPACAPGRRYVHDRRPHAVRGVGARRLRRDQGGPPRGREVPEPDLATRSAAARVGRAPGEPLGAEFVHPLQGRRVRASQGERSG